MTQSCGSLSDVWNGEYAGWWLVDYLHISTDSRDANWARGHRTQPATTLIKVLYTKQERESKKEMGLSFFDTFRYFQTGKTNMFKTN